MGDPTGFLKYKRKESGHRDIADRVKDFKEIEIPLSPEAIQRQAARCMDCGIPFCHGFGCPVSNLIPDFNDMIFHGRWEEACKILHSKNNFPEITGRVCPAPCETACTLGINDAPVLIKHIEYQVIERGWQEGWIKPLTPKQKTDKKVAVIGSGPAGLAAAQQLVRFGHDVVVFEKSESIGGLLRYGIPDFKLDKLVIDRRVRQMQAEGVDFQMAVSVGEDISARYLDKHFDAVCLAMGAGRARDLNILGRELGNIYFAMEFLSQQNQIVSGELRNIDRAISAKDKVVVVLGGGDTGSDCVGTARRQGAKEIFQLEILPKPPETRPLDTPWPLWPRIMRTSSSHEEGCERQWSVQTKKFSGSKNGVQQLHCCLVEWVKTLDGWKIEEVKGSEFVLKADIVLLALGFVHVVHKGLIEELKLNLETNGNVTVENFQTSQPWVFAAGDTVEGASLVVRAINSGRKAADSINKWLLNK